MPTNIHINNITGATPFNIYLCYPSNTSCIYIDTIPSSSLPYDFLVPSILEGELSYSLKVIDNNDCVFYQNVVIGPPPTPTNTPTNTPTQTPGASPSQTPTQTPTQTTTQTPGASPSQTPTMTQTQTSTPTMTQTPTSTSPISPIQEYCVNWTAANVGGGKMSTQGYIDFTVILNGRTIQPGPASVGAITAYRIFGETTDRSCNIEMDFTPTTATWDTSLLDAPAGTALYTLIYNLEVIFSDFFDYPINLGQSTGTVTPGGTTSSYNNCIPTTQTPTPTKTQTPTPTPTTTTTTAAPPVNSVEPLSGDWPPTANGISPGNIIQLNGTLEIIGTPVTFRAYSYVPAGPVGEMGSVSTSTSIGNVNVGITSMYIEAEPTDGSAVELYSPNSVTLPAGIYNWEVLCTFAGEASVNGEGGLVWTQG